MVCVDWRSGWPPRNILLNDSSWGGSSCGTLQKANFQRHEPPPSSLPVVWGSFDSLCWSSVAFSGWLDYLLASDSVYHCIRPLWNVGSYFCSWKVNRQLRHPSSRRGVSRCGYVMKWFLNVVCERLVPMYRQMGRNNTNECDIMVLQLRRNDDSLTGWCDERLLFPLQILPCRPHPLRYLFFVVLS